MNCLVCGKRFDGGECPRCGFPEIHFPGDPEAGIKKLQPTVKAYRKKFLEQIQVGLLIYLWKDENGVVVPDREERLSLGNGAELLDQVVWLPRKFARIPEVQELQVRVYIDIAQDSREVTVHLPNLMGAELQELGMTVDEDITLHLLLRSSAEEQVVSDGVSLLEKD